MEQTALAFEPHADGSLTVNHTQPDDTICKMTQGFSHMLNFPHVFFTCLPLPRTPTQGNPITALAVDVGKNLACLWNQEKCHWG